MLTTELYKQLLITPANDGADRLSIISGYASASMTYKHINELLKINQNIKIDLIIGMASSEGLTFNNHTIFNKLIEGEFKDILSCRYIYKRPPVHSKIYIWSSNNKPIKAFIGSANYTQNVFINQGIREAVTECDALEAYNYFCYLNKDTILCNDPKADKFFVSKSNVMLNNVNENKNLITISLLDNKGNVPKYTALNSGQRLKNKNDESFLKTTKKVVFSGFFPIVDTIFTIVTDDGITFICKTTNNNTIETIQDNKLFGEYFRNRLGISKCQPITIDDLNKYGRTDINFSKNVDETYLMDFSIKS